MNSVTYLNGENGVFGMGSKMQFMLSWSSKDIFENMKMRIGIFTVSQMAVGISYSESFSGKNGENRNTFTLDISRLLPGRYCLELIMTEIDDHGNLVKHDVINRDVVMFEIEATEEKKVFRASNSTWGYYELPETTCK